MEIQEALALAEAAHTKKFMMGEILSGAEEALIVLTQEFVKLRDASDNRKIHKQRANKEERTKTLVTELEKIHTALAAAVALGDGKVTLDDGRIIINLDERVIGGWAMEGVDQTKLPKGVNVMQKIIVPKLLEVEDKFRAAVRTAFPDGEVLVTSGNVYVMEPF